MTDSPETLNLTGYAYTLGGLLSDAIEHKLRLTISTVEGQSTHGTPVHYSWGDGGLVTLTEGNDVWFVPLAQITKIAPNPASAPVTVHTL